jgi:hypothetical protein
MKTRSLLFPVFLLITLIAFYPTIGAGFVFDFLGWQRVYDAGSFGDILNSFGYSGNHQVLHFFFYSIYSIFHIKGLPWYIIFCTLHAFNAWLFYSWLTQINLRWKINAPGLLITLTCILFLIHPYNVEPVVWKVCIHYLLSLAAVLILLLYVPRYTEQGEHKYLWLSLLIFSLSIFLLELSYITPLVITLYLVIDAYAAQKTSHTFKRVVVIISGMWGLLAAGLLLNKWTLGNWVGHYGASTHLRLDIIGMMSTEIKYLVKHLTDARYFSFKTKSLIFDRILSNPELIFFFLVLGIAVVLVYFIRARKIPGYLHLAFFGVAASMLYVLPVSNLFFYHLHVGANDRLSYLPLLFLLAGLTALLSRAPRWAWISLMGIILLVQVYLQEKTITYWKESTAVLHSLRDTFRWHDRSHVFVLNSPDNLNGIVMTSIIEAPSGIDELIDFQTAKPYDGVMYDVFQYNMTTPYDGVTVEQTGPMQLKVTFKQWGNWWHRNGIGASTYENEYYKAETLDYPYMITFKQLPEGSAIIYQDGKEWKEFFLSEK